MKRSAETKTLTTAHYSIELVFDYFNERLRIVHYQGELSNILEDIQEMVNEHPFSKVIFHTRPEHWEQLLSCGFELEAIFKGFFSGTDNYAMTFYKTDKRRTSKSWVKEDEILSAVLAKGRHSETKITPVAYHFRRATTADAKKLAELYGSVFAIYPAPMNEPEYVRKVMKNSTVFYIVEHNDEIVSAASADMNKTFHHAELTDCATLPEHRKYGLMKKLLIHLENELRKEEIYCAFSIARALSFGMNAAFYQLGYEYKGRLTNNCYIFDKLEDMNVWVKDLST